MDYRCPVCTADLGKRRFGQAIMIKMTTQCSHCNSVLHLNVHRSETIVVAINFAVIVVLAAFAYWFQSRDLVLVAVGAAMAGAAALPLLERSYLRSWPRYASIIGSPDPSGKQAVDAVAGSSLARCGGEQQASGRNQRES